jgi:2,4-diketo-3-deoxy-L-fuconate hydrolase
MKLLRYGPNGHEMPGILDNNGHIHDLSGEVPDISEEGLLPLSLDRLGVQHRVSLPVLSLEIRRYPPADPQARK